MMVKHSELNQQFMPDDLKKEIEGIMYPERADQEVQISIIFAFADDEKDDAILKRLAEIRSFSAFMKNGRQFYRMDFKLDEIRQIHDSYQLIDSLPHKEVLINGFKLPYSGNLWLSLLWFYLI